MNEGVFPERAPQRVAGRRTILLAAHGAGDGSAACRAVRELARFVAERLPADDVRIGFRLGTPRLEDALADASDDVVVLPIMATNGYFVRVVLPALLAPALRGRRVVWRPAIGSDPLVQEALVRAAWAVGGADGCEADAPSFLVVGHGTLRDARSEEGTYALVTRLRRSLPAAVTVGFLDQLPSLEDGARALPGGRVVVVPHLLGGGTHHGADIVTRLRAVRPDLFASGAPSPAGAVNTPAHAPRLEGRSFRMAPALFELPGFDEHVVRLLDPADRRRRFPPGPRLGRRRTRLATALVADHARNAFLDDRARTGVLADGRVRVADHTLESGRPAQRGRASGSTQAPVSGKVYLVGAGPGDPELLTIRGLRALREADVVLHDDLAPSELLAHLRPGALAISVGKGPGDSVAQETIDALLLEHAGRGAVVVRLKGGDPCVFGRGWEEATFCAAHGIAWEIVPGVTSAVAVPALAGIPVTLREVARSFCVVTGHTVSEDTVDWDAAARIDTLVVLMGVRTLPQIVARLLAAGRDPATPVAIVMQGATPGQRTVRGPLGAITAIAAREEIASPAVIVVGAVAGLALPTATPGPSVDPHTSSPISFGSPRVSAGRHDPRPSPWLGRRIVVTRPHGAARPLAARLRALGARPIWCPLVATEWVTGVWRNDFTPAPAGRVARGASCDDLTPGASCDDLATGPSCDDLAAADWVVFDSKHGVEGFFRALDAHGTDLRVLGGKRIAAVGPSTAHALRERGIRADLVPRIARADELVAALRVAAHPGQADPATRSAPLAGVRFVFPCGHRALEPITRGLRAAGAAVTPIAVYRTVPRRPSAETARVLAAGVDAILFHCPSAVSSFVEAGLPVGDAVVVCVGAATGARALALGLHPVVPEGYGDEAMLGATEAAWASGAATRP